MRCEHREGTTRILIVDDQTVVRRAVRGYLETLGDFEVVGEASTGSMALDELRSLDARGLALPDVMLLDLLMPNLDGVATTAGVLQEFPRTRVIILTSFGHKAEVRAALANGATTYLLKDADPNELATTIRAVVQIAPGDETAGLRQAT